MTRPALALCLGCALGVMLAQPAQAQKSGRKSKNVITQEEIAKASGSDAYAVIRSLRPMWLVTRGASSTNAGTDASGSASLPGGIAVYVDGVPRGGLDELRNIDAATITEMRFLSAMDATTKYGTGNPAGAIEIDTKH